jgi:hypothetical protein
LIQPALRHLGVTKFAVTPLLRSLHVHAVTVAWAMVTLRRKLERTNAFRSSPVIPLGLHDYPP